MVKEFVVAQHFDDVVLDALGYWFNAIRLNVVSIVISMYVLCIWLVAPFIADLLISGFPKWSPLNSPLAEV